MRYFSCYATKFACNQSQVVIESMNQWNSWQRRMQESAFWIISNYGFKGRLHNWSSVSSMGQMHEVQLSYIIRASLMFIGTSTLQTTSCLINSLRDRISVSHIVSPWRTAWAKLVTNLGVGLARAMHFLRKADEHFGNMGSWNILKY